MVLVDRARAVCPNFCTSFYVVETEWTFFKGGDPRRRRESVVVEEDVVEQDGYEEEMSGEVFRNIISM